VNYFTFQKRKVTE